MPKLAKHWIISPTDPNLKMRDGHWHDQDGKRIRQSLYFPDNYEDARLAGMFKGMQKILEECGLWPQGGLLAQCKNFHCPDPENKFDCCARHLLFNQPDFKNQKSLLQELVESRGHICLFYPKFHPELNPIEMCWGRAKFYYQMEEIPRNEAEMEQQVIAALDKIDITAMRRFANRAARFMDAYNQGLTGTQAARANKRFHSHRTLPPELVAEMKSLY